MSYDGSEITDAFLMYRDYDGAGGKFGDTWIDATSANQSQVSVYAARRSSDGADTIMVINKSTASVTSPLTLSGGISGSVSTWQWAGAGISSVPGASIVDGAITATYPPMSMTMYVVK